MAKLTPADLAMFRQLGISADLLERAGVERVDDRSARDKYGLNGSGDNTGIVFPYVDAAGVRHTCRLRRDHPDIQDGKPVRKYLAPYGDRRHLYIIPGDHRLGKETAVPVVLVEAEKSALAIRAFADRTGRHFLPIALGGCWAWRGRIGKVENSKGERVDEVGPLPELRICADGRKVYILLDSNVATNGAVRQARNALVRQLLKQKADVHVLDLPTLECANGPDDYLALKGDGAMTELLDSPPAPTAGWRSLLICTERKNPQPRPILANAITALRHAPEWQGVLASDEFSLHVVTNKPTPWGGPVGRNWTDADDSLATEWLQHQGILVASKVAAEAVQTVARENSFHPIRDYLHGLNWDGERRLDTFLVKYAGCPDTPWTRAVGPRWMISAVARVEQPGCQADYTLLVEGPQGILKSTFLRTLTGDRYFTDHLSDLGTKDARLDLHGVWVIEMSEMVSMRRSKVERVKAFLTARTDHFRMPYGRRAEDVPRQNVFAATTNDETPFVDASGNRRFWPVRFGKVDIEVLRRDRDQLWAEAYARYKSGEAWWLDKDELNVLAKAEQDERYDEGVWDAIILDWVNNPRRREEPAGNGSSVMLPVEPWHESRPGRISLADVLVHGIGKDADRCTQADRNQVASCLRHNGWKREQDRSRGPSRGKWFYHKCDNQGTP